MKLNLPIEAARILIGPNGDYGYSDFVQFVNLVTFEDLRAAGLKVVAARE